MLESFVHQSDREAEDESVERMGSFAHELRNLISTALMSFDAIRRGRATPDSPVGAILHRSLLGLRDRVDLSLAEVRLDAGAESLQLVRLSELIPEVEASASMHAQARELQFALASTPEEVVIRCDPSVLTATLTNLLQNAFKFTPKLGRVSLTTRAIPDRVFFDIQDECGGLSPGRAEELFRPFEQRALDRSGLGLGLSICRKAARAMQGDLRVLNLPGEGCIFTLDLPRAQA